MPNRLPGQVMLDLTGLELTIEERELLNHPHVGGVILFTRNYQNKQQLQQLTRAIHQIKPATLIAADQEGGRVQRFRDEFIALPPAQYYGELYDQNPAKALQIVADTAIKLTQELLAAGIDLNFAPVLDINQGKSSVIGDRSFHHNPTIVAKLTGAFMAGMQRAGMPAIAKHFPGHGGVVADSHNSSPIDRRTYSELSKQDLIPFQALIKRDLAAVMPAHVIYPAIDKHPASLSTIWLQTILRKQLGFQGVIFSDDLSMHGASVLGDYPARAQAALTAGNDMILVCNNRAGAIAVLDSLASYSNIPAQTRLMQLKNYNKII